MRDNETVFGKKHLRVDDGKASESQTTRSGMIRSQRLEPCPLNRVQLSAMVAELMD